MEGALLPPVSVVVPSRERPDLLADAVGSILAGDLEPAELIVVDQSRTANQSLVALSRTHPVLRYLHRPGRGLSAARNLGVAAARHELVALADDDVLVAKDWLRRLVEASVRAGPDAVITGRLMPGEPEVPGGVAPTSRVGEEPRCYAGRIWHDPFLACNGALRREPFSAVGGFDERLGPGTRFPGAEDSDLGYRLLEAGYRIVYAPEVVAYHRAWRAGREIARTRWNYGLGQGAFFAKHASVRDPYMLRRSGLLLGRYAKLIVHRLRSDPQRARSDLTYAAGVAAGMVAWWTRSRRAPP